MHEITFTTSRRQVGRSRITDHFWRCSCGDTTTAPNGFSTREQAESDARPHRRTHPSSAPDTHNHKETRSPMSQARRMYEALVAARENTQAAASAAVQHRHRERSSLPQHITDMDDLAQAMAAIHGIAADVAAVAKSCADNVRAHYCHGDTPGHTSWPEPLKQAAADADRALSKLRSHLSRTPANAGYTTLSVLHELIRQVHRAQSSK